MEYSRRLVDDILDEVFPGLTAVALKGAKAVGKTATASQRAASTLSLNNPATLEAVTDSLDLVTYLPAPVFVDEWQLHPPVWDRIRRAVDDNPTPSQFLLAGSAGLAPGIRVHSGAGRIVSLQMRPLSFLERGLETPTVSLAQVLAGTQGEVGGSTRVALPTYVDEILRSGFPGIRTLPDRARRLQLDSYLARIVHHELPENGVNVRRPAALMAWLSAYAAATASDAAWSTIVGAAALSEVDRPTRQTANVYREHLQRLFILDPVDAWIPTFSPLKRLTQAPKHHLVDPALAAHLVGIDSLGLLTGKGQRLSGTGTWLGALFESLVTQSVRIYADVCEATVGHLRTRSTEHEVDLVVEGRDRQVVAIEVKTSDTVRPSDVVHLHWLQDQLGDRLAASIVVNAGPHAYRRPDGILVVPFALLGP